MWRKITEEDFCAKVDVEAAQRRVRGEILWYISSNSDIPLIIL